MQTVVYNSPFIIVFPLYIIITVLHFPHERRGLHDPILVLINSISSSSYAHIRIAINSGYWFKVLYKLLLRIIENL